MEAVMKTLVRNTAPALPWPWLRLTRKEFLAFVVRLDEAYRQRRALESLDDRLLKDIGITRSDVVREVERPLLPLR
jgi:uncharacterized protein YjiS (DUF1127 family)